MSSKEQTGPLDLERGLRLTEADIEALRRSRRHPPMTPAEYLRLLSSFAVSPAALRARHGPRGPERFRL